MILGQAKVIWVPFIFVAHSMGGLVVKKARMLGKMNDQHMETIKSVRAIVFLSTPHRGSDLIPVLSSILGLTFTPKRYVDELTRNSSTLFDINEDFRHPVKELQIASLYETRQTGIWPIANMIVEKNSSILGYPNEIIESLNADHRNVCKFASTEDPNFHIVRDVLREMVNKCQSQAVTVSALASSSPPQTIQSLLGISSDVNDDFEYFRSRSMQGSCRWFLDEPLFKTWLNQDNKSNVLWIWGIPGAGKSVLVSSVISYLRRIGIDCHYFFFRHRDQCKRSISTALRALAFQIARNLPQYRDRLLNLITDEFAIQDVGLHILWDKLFGSSLCEMSLPSPIILVMDALDECDAPQKLINLLTGFACSKGPVRILLTSRMDLEISNAVERLKSSLLFQSLIFDATDNDIKKYISQEVGYLLVDKQLKPSIFEKILKASRGSFLWVNLVMEEITKCQSEAAIEKAISGILAGLDPMYRRMTASLDLNKRTYSQGLIETILMWVVHAHEPLCLPDLAQALAPEHTNFLNLEYTISHGCGGFVTVDSYQSVEMLHQTARRYLLEPPSSCRPLIFQEAHKKISMRCLQAFSRCGHPRAYKTLPPESFRLYAATSWPYHLGKIGSDVGRSLLTELAHFFQHSAILAWIQLLASKNRISDILYASQSIELYLATVRNDYSTDLLEQEFVKHWARDLARIVGKFGLDLLQNSKAIYALIPPFCPKESMISHCFYSSRRVSCLTVMGQTPQWDDLLARIYDGQVKRATGLDDTPSKIIINEHHIAIATSQGIILLFHVLTFAEMAKFVHGEMVDIFQFSDSCQQMVSYGDNTTKMWGVEAGYQIWSIPNPAHREAISMTLDLSKGVLLACLNDGYIRQVKLNKIDKGWIRVGPCLSKYRTEWQYFWAESSVQPRSFTGCIGS